MGASATFAQNEIVGLREVLNNEDDMLRELSLRGAKENALDLELFTHDLAPKCAFADSVVAKRV